MFDDRNTFWFPFPGFAGFEVAVNRLDPELGLADFLIKFEPNSVIHLYRHMAETSTFVVQGEPGCTSRTGLSKTCGRSGPTP